MAKANAGQALKAAQARIVSLERELRVAEDNSLTRAEHHQARNNAYVQYVNHLHSLIYKAKQEVTAFKARVLNDSLRISRLRHKYTQACLLAVATTTVLVVDTIMTIWG